MDASGLRRFSTIALALALAACADGSRHAAAPAPTAVYAPAPSVASPPPAQPGPRPAPDQCGLSELRGMVGKSRLEIPIPIEPGRRRVLCDSCPKTEDFSPGRQTVLFDARTGIVTSVSCG